MVLILSQVFSRSPSDILLVTGLALTVPSVAGHARVLLGGGKKRFGESAVDELAALKNAKPARYPHADNTDASATELAELFEQFVDDVDLAGCSRWAMYNMWRSVTPPPQESR